MNSLIQEVKLQGYFALGFCNKIWTVCSAMTGWKKKNQAICPMWEIWSSNDLTKNLSIFPCQVNDCWFWLSRSPGQVFTRFWAQMWDEWMQNECVWPCTLWLVLHIQLSLYHITSPPFYQRSLKFHQFIFLFRNQNLP